MRRSWASWYAAIVLISENTYKTKYRVIKNWTQYVLKTKVMDKENPEAVINNAPIENVETYICLGHMTSLSQIIEINKNQKKN